MAAESREVALSLLDSHSKRRPANDSGGGGSSHAVPFPVSETRIFNLSRVTGPLKLDTKLRDDDAVVSEFRWQRWRSDAEGGRPSLALFPLALRSGELCFR